MTAFLTGMGTSAGLIMAIGAQNTYILTQSVRKNHHVTIGILCALFEVILISAGVAGVGSFLSASPLFTKIAAWAGAGFLFVYGCFSLRSAFRKSSMNLLDKPGDSLKKVVLTTIAVTLLNPHVYIDTVLLMGGIASQFESSSRLMFGIGACTASLIWFYLLTFAGLRLAPLFSRPLTWKLLDVSVCVIMWSIGISLIV